MKITFSVTGICGLARVQSGELRVVAAADAPVRTAPAGHGHGHAHGHASPGAEDNTCALPRHRAYLRFDINQLGLVYLDGNGVPLRPINFKVDANATTYAHFLFENEILFLRRVLPNNTPQLGPVTINRDSIIDMNEVVPGKHIMNPALVAATYDPVETRVSARLDLQSGDVKAGPVDVKAIHQFEPTLGAKPYAGSFAQEVTVAFNDAVGTEWHLRSREFNDDENNAVTILKFTGQANTFSVVFGNVPVEDILGLNQKATEEVDQHFALMYNLLAEPPSALSLPKRVSAFQRNVSAIGSNCPPAIFG